MPASSKSQLRFMAAIASGNLEMPGISKEKAAEFVHATKNAKKLPEKSEKFKRLKKQMKV